MTVCTREMRDAFFDALYERAVDDRRIVVLSNDFGAPSLDKFRTDMPERFINAGISEQNIIGVAAGLAMGGRRVCVYSIASFITLRCFEQIKLDLCVMNLPVTIAGVGPCYAYDADGPTHHASEDVAILRTLAHMSIYSPCDSHAAAAMAHLVPEGTGPAYVRLDRGKLPERHPMQVPLDAGFTALQRGIDVCLVATGVMTHRACEVAATLRQRGVQAAVLDVYRLKPLPAAALIAAIRPSARVVTIEEHTLQGGLGSMVLEALADAGEHRPLMRIGIADEHIYAYGRRDALQCLCGLDHDAITARITAWL